MRRVEAIDPARAPKAAAELYNPYPAAPEPYTWSAKETSSTGRFIPNMATKASMTIGQKIVGFAST